MTGSSTTIRFQDASHLYCLDISHLQELSTERRSSFMGMLQEYIQRAGELLHTLEGSKTRINYDALKGAARTLKSSSARIDAVGVQHLAGEIETASDNRDEPTVRTGLLKLKLAVDRTLALLRNFLHG